MLQEKEWTNREDLIDFIELNKYSQNTPSTLNFKQYPLKVDYEPSVGLFLKTTRQIIKGETVLVEAPVTLGIHDTYCESYCGFCAVSITRDEVKQWKLDKENDPKSILCHKCSKNAFIKQVNNLIRAMGIKFVGLGSTDVGLYRMLVRLVFGYAHARHENEDPDLVVPSGFESMFLLAYQPLSKTGARDNIESDLLLDLEAVADTIYGLSKGFQR